MYVIFNNTFLQKSYGQMLRTRKVCIKVSPMVRAQLRVMSRKESIRRDGQD